MGAILVSQLKSNDFLGKPMIRLILTATSIFLFCVIHAAAIESAPYEVVHAESDFEIRRYTHSSWMSAAVNDLSFQKSTILGFHRLFQFTQGANLNWTRIDLTVPVVTSVIPGIGPLHSAAFVVRLYLPAKFQLEDPPVPLPELNLEQYAWDDHCVAVRKFSGFATDKKVLKEAEKLAASLQRSPWANSSAGSDYAYSIAQYDPPFRFIGRINEVWVDVEAATIDGCRYIQIATS